MSDRPERPYIPFEPDQDPATAAEQFRSVMDQRRSVRVFSDEPVDRVTIEEIIRAAGTAPSGAHKQPWTFVAVSNPALKRHIRIEAEAEERLFYEDRAPDEWLKALEPFNTDANKPFLEEAPWLIAVFRQTRTAEGDKTYYSTESVGIACGFLIAAIHHAGLVCLTHTPVPMQFLAEILERPANEKPFLLIPVGHAPERCTVPVLQRKSLDEILIIRD